LDDRIGIMESTRNLALSYVDHGEFEQSQKMLEQSNQLVQELNISYQRILFFKEKGWILSQMGQPKQSLAVLQQALNMFPLERHFLSRSQIHSNIGLIYFRKNNSKEAIRHFNKSLIYAKHGQVTDRMGLVSLNIALCSILSGDNHVAEQAFVEGARQLQKIKNYRGLAALLANLSLFRMTNGKIEAAREHAKRSKMLCKRFPHPVTEYLLAFIQTFLYIEGQNFQKAYEEISFAKELVKRKQIVYKFTECYAVCVEVLIRLNNIQKAQEHFALLEKDISPSDPSDPSHLFLLKYANYWMLTQQKSKDELQQEINHISDFVDVHLSSRPDVHFMLQNIKRNIISHR
jgi:tetratricopeptide (TPR) repeat protein